MRSVDDSISKAYIAPENFDPPYRHSGHVERPDGTLEFSPVFGTILEAVEWARATTDFVVARESEGPYVWYGRGPAPSDYETPPN